MKGIIILLLLIPFLVYSQNVRTVPQDHDWTTIFNGTLGAGADGIDTTSAFSPKQWKGVCTLAFETDTAGASIKSANQSDSSLTVGLQLKDKSLDWGCWYGNITTFKGVTNFSKVDTVARAIVNRTASYWFFELGGQDAWQWADSARLIVYIGVGDSLDTRIDVGGQ